MATASFGIVGLLAAGSPSVHADPAFYSAQNGPRVGVGSNNTQALWDAFTGAEPYQPNSFAQPTTFYTPIHTGAATDFVGAESFDAIPQGGTSLAPGCITTKLNGPAFDRPNGSSNGILALTAANTSGGTWEATTGSCTGAPVSVAGQIDFARSSRLPKATGSLLTFIPMSQGALSYAFYDHGTGHLNNLTTAQIQSVYNSATGTATINGDTVIACIMQSGSGTRSSWENAIGVGDAQVVIATNATGCGSSNEIEENNADSFLARVGPSGLNLPAGTDAIVGFAAHDWAAQANLVALDVSSTLRAAENGENLDGLGSIDGVEPLTGAPGSFLPNTPYFEGVGTVNNYGEPLFNVVWTTKLGPVLSGGDKVLQALFVGPTSVICSAATQATINKFGEDTLTGTNGELTCGSTTLTGNN